MEEDPFPFLQASDVEVLNIAKERVICESCGRKRMYFCYSCLKYVNGLEKVMPSVHLPVGIDIIKHQQELDSKSTAVHALLLAREHCNLYTFPDIPDYNPETDVLIFPSSDALSIDDWSAKKLASRQQTTSKVVFIDCTWNQVHSIVNSPKLLALPRVMLNSYKTKFWRPNGSKRGLIAWQLLKLFITS